MLDEYEIRMVKSFFATASDAQLEQKLMSLAVVRMSLKDKDAVSAHDWVRKQLILEMEARKELKLVQIHRLNSTTP